MNRGAPQDPLQARGERSNDTASAHDSAPPQQPSLVSPNNNKSNMRTPVKANCNGDPKDLAKTPLCICPTCEKVLNSMKSLYGHHGRAHRCSVDQDLIKYACPFCDNGEDEEFQVFGTTAALESHIVKSHPECTLLTSLTDTSSNAAAKAARASSKKATKETTGQKSSSPTSDASPSAAVPAKKKKRSSSRRSAGDAQKRLQLLSQQGRRSSNGGANGKPPAQRHEHPLCKCPRCDKILPPQGIFGHFGRVHSGQLGGDASRFEWDKVEYACPFCLGDDDGSPPRLFRTIELIEAHVVSHHPHCHLTRPQALSRGSGGVSKPNAIGSAATVAKGLKRKSQRDGRRRSADQEPEEEEEGEEGREGDDNDDDDEEEEEEELEEDEKSRSSSPGATTRKSRRSRRPVHNGPMIAEDSKRGGGRSRAAAAEDGVTRYDCPDCDKRNLTKHGLHAHYGMVHGGRVDFSRVRVIHPKIRKPAPAATAGRVGPWTEEEHAAFLEGHARYGNRWKRIATECVPTRDAKQIGSHALNYFTTRGEWQGIGRSLDREVAAAGTASDGSAASSGEEGRRRSRREKVRKRPRHSPIGNDIVVARPPMGADDDGEEVGGESTDISAGSEVSAGVKDNEGNEEEDDDGKEEGVVCTVVAEDDDGNSSHCIVCFQGGNIVCCSACPRAFHPKCLAKDGHGNINIDLLPNDWRCNRCKKDFVIEAGEEISQKYMFGTKKIRAAYAEFKDCSDYNKACSLLSNILDVVNKLKTYDYGYVFSEPVDLDDVPDYTEVVRTPMDYSTISERLEGGNYVDLITSEDVSCHDENSTMEEILLHVLCDIDRVHHNCQLYNKKGSSIFRIGGVHASKWNAYLSQYILDRLPENVQRDLTVFRRRCKRELKDGSHEKQRKKKSTTATTPSRSPSTMGQTPTTGQKKRKASGPPEEKDAEEATGNIDEEQPKPKAKKTKQDDSTSPSPALLFTEEQLRALENVFFSSVHKLREELEELDACSALTSLLACSPANGTENTMTCVKSELSLYGLDQNPEVPPSGTAAASAKIPEVITSTLEPSPAIAKPSSCSAPTSTVDVPTAISSAAQSKGEVQGTTFQRQWYERLNELKKYKVVHGTAVVSATSNDKLYHWRLRQRKRYHLTLFRMPHLKKESPAWDENGVDKNGKEWLLAMPEMKGVFSLSLSNDGDGRDTEVKPVTIEDKFTALDEKSVDTIIRKHQQQLYCPLQQPFTLASLHSSRHTNSLFWDESLEELRFFQGDHNHTLVPRDFPHNIYLPIWVEIQRARYLLQSVGLFSGLTGWQMLVLDEELDLCDFSSLPTVDVILMNDGPSDSSRSKTAPPKGGEGKKGGKNKNRPENSSPERKKWSTHTNDFREWYQKLSPEDKPRAFELLPRANWQLYSWCWRQCNASSALLSGTPNILGVNMSVKKLNTLASAGFFRAFPYNDRSAGLVCEDDYESCEAFDSTLRVLENFSIKYGTTRIPDWYECDGAFRMWIAALTNGLSNFVKGEPCVLSARQIEKLILIGFFQDRDELPNLSKNDVVFLRMVQELKRHLGLFGDCSVSKDYPILHGWIAEQKELFRLSRMGNKDMMSASRLQMLMEAGVDFFTGECLPGTDDSIQRDFKEFRTLTSSPAETFPSSRATHNNANFGWNFLSYDKYWNEFDCRARFQQMKAKNGHSLVLASDGDLYWWVVEKRGAMLLHEINYPESSQASESGGLQSHSILNFITAQQEADDAGSDGDEIEVDKSMFLWLHYCERLMIFKARKGHCKIPKEYPDRPLRRWLARQQELIYSYSTNQPTELLPVQVKILYALGLHGSKRIGAPPKLSSRNLKRRAPSRKDKKRDLDKSKIG